NCFLPKSNLKQADLRNANLTNANLREAVLVKTQLNQAYLTLADLRQADLTNADLSDTELKGANLTGINLSTVMNIKGAKMRQTILRDVKLTRLTLRNANLTDAILMNADLSHTDLAGADLTKANLTNADLTNADLRWSSLVEANMLGVNLSGAILDETDFARSDLLDVNWTEARLIKAKNLHKAKNYLNVIPQKTPVLIRAQHNSVKTAASGKNKKGVGVSLSAPIKRKIKIWELKIEHVGQIRAGMKKLENFSAFFLGASDIEANMIKHQIFSNGKQGISGKIGSAVGVLYSVNFIPEEEAVPLEIKWFSPDDRLLKTDIIPSNNSQRNVATFRFAAKETLFFGTWAVRFYYKGELLAEEHIRILDPEGYSTHITANR
ncbi:pentapeptide repeat-containing protein, partial [Candidatus Pacearchaeota archaeon]|nr:pentapeptide repeat-containing protein [Candidatus Pacearchaeota archaeon]